MGEEELELLRAAASQDGLELASLNWILASLMSHGFVAISFSNDRRLRAAATEAGYLALKMRPLLPEAGSSIHWNQFGSASTQIKPPETATGAVVAA
jgi:hypothetical protein